MLNAELNQINKTLTLTIDGDDQEELIELLEASYNQAEAFMGDLLHEQWAFISPESIGALTDAPILCNDVSYDDNGDEVVNGVVAWYPNYMVSCPWDELADTGMVVFTVAD